jgi:hypothetical protein
MTARRHTTSTYEFQSTGILLAGTGEHAVRVLGALAAPQDPFAGPKERAVAATESYRAYVAGEVSGDQEEPDVRPYHPQVPSAYVTRGGELEFLERDWTGIDLDAVRLPDLPSAPAQAPPVPGAPSEPPTEPAPPPPAAGPDRWGGYDLRRADADDEPRWGGETRSAAAGDEMPDDPAADGFVRRLQEDLAETGFAVVGTPDGDFGRNTSWAVRELQIYAKMEFLAVESAADPPAPVYGDRLSRVQNGAVYTGPVSGVLNAQTRACLATWLANRWRCPVVVEARTGTAVVHQNLWGKDDLQDSAPRMSARDWSGHYTLPASVTAGDQMTLGDWQSAGQGGPSSRAPGHTHADAELTPEVLVGSDLASLSAAQLSSYKVVRACSEVECMGYADSLTAWDNAIMSAGPCHWTLGLISGGTVDDGELCGYLAYLREVAAAEFAAVFGFFGARPTKEWSTDGQGPFNASQRKYAAWVEQETESGFAETPRTAADANYFRTWHWFHRFAMAGRTEDEWKRRMWDMARVRVRDILATPWGAGPPAVAGVDDGAGGTRPATIGDVVTSEQAVAMLVRWHIYRPAGIVSGGESGPRLRGALQRAGNTGDPSSWGDAEEQALIDGLMAEAVAELPGVLPTLTMVRDWHSWDAATNPRRYALDPSIDDLDAARGSFTLDTAGLPAAPAP